MKQKYYIVAEKNGEVKQGWIYGGFCQTVAQVAIMFENDGYKLRVVSSITETIGKPFPY